MDKHNKQAIYIMARDRYEKAIETMLEIGIEQLSYSIDIINEDLQESKKSVFKTKGIK